MKRKCVLLTVLCFIGFLIVGITFMYITYHKRFNEYNQVISYGIRNINTEQDNIIVSIDAFLESVTGEKDKTCFNLLTIEEEQEELQICSSIEKVNWDNPYGNYDKWIPVNFFITYSNKIVSKY
jgi:hypothetical protein